MKQAIYTSAMQMEKMDISEKKKRYEDVAGRISALIEGERDLISRLSTVVCELHVEMPHFHWTGFYRVVDERLLKVGPYQGTHGCLEISFDRGVCGACAREKKTQLVDDVEAFPGHIACSSSTRSEIVVPVFGPSGDLRAVFDVDSNWPAAFDAVDQEHLENVLSGVYLD